MKVKRLLNDLSGRIRADGYKLEIYQVPLVVDDRLAKSRIIHRLLGIVDIKADLDVLCLYSSVLRPWGTGIIWSYGKNCRAIGVGSSGDIGISEFDHQPSNWDELKHDLLLAWGCTNTIYIHTLEGCYQQGFLRRLSNFEWDQIFMEPSEAGNRIDQIRLSIQVFLWIISHYYIFLGLGWIITLLFMPRHQKKGNP